MLRIGWGLKVWNCPSRDRAKFEFLRRLQRLACVLVIILVDAAHGAVHTVNLSDAVRIAQRQNPDILLARLDEQRAADGIAIANAPFSPKLEAGSEPVFTYGYPNSVKGYAPSIAAMRGSMSLYNRPDRYDVAVSRERAKVAQRSSEERMENVAYQIATLFLDAQKLHKQETLIQSQSVSLAKVVETIRSQVDAGAQLPIELDRINVEAAGTRQRLESIRIDELNVERLLAVAVGFSANDLVQPADDHLYDCAVKPEYEAVRSALEHDPTISILQSNLMATQLQLRGREAMRLPQMDLIAQYSMLKRQNYADYFPPNRIQRNNAEIGASLTLPLLIGSARGGLASQDQLDAQRLRIQIDSARNHLAADVHRSYQLLQKAKGALELGHQELDLAAAALSVQMALRSEGRRLPSDVERARIDVDERSLEICEAEVQVAKAQLAIEHQLGTLISRVSVARLDNDPLSRQ